jgi:hypothetical protein
MPRWNDGQVAATTINGAAQGDCSIHGKEGAALMAALRGQELARPSRLGSVSGYLNRPWHDHNLWSIRSCFGACLTSCTFTSSFLVRAALDPRVHDMQTREAASKGHVTPSYRTCSDLQPKVIHDTHGPPGPAGARPRCMRAARTAGRKFLENFETSMYFLFFPRHRFSTKKKRTSKWL